MDIWNVESSWYKTEFEDYFYSFLSFEACDISATVDAYSKSYIVEIVVTMMCE